MPMNHAATLLNLLAMVTLIVPNVSPEEMTALDVLDAYDAAAFWWEALPGTVCHMPDGRTLTKV